MFQKQKHLLEQGLKIVQHDQILRKVKGEDFNIFSIMRMEYDENKTHSNFIAELLNPKGSHLLGNAFLREFLSMLYPMQDSSVQTEDYINVDDLLKSATPKVFTEYHTGKVDLDNKSGGRIDILIEIGMHTISIENKINAGDQEVQLKRYHNYRQGSNHIIYLTLDGRAANNYTLDDLLEKDYSRLSYAIDIRDWLTKCIQISVNYPVIRESIKQYQLLIKKITHQMDSSLNEELHNLIRKNLSTASVIHHNYFEEKNKIKAEILTEIFKRLGKVIYKYDFEMHLGHDVNKKHSQIWMHTKGISDAKVSIGIETFSGDENANEDGTLYCGVFIKNGVKEITEQINTKWEYSHWPVFKHIYNSDGDQMRFSKLETLELFLDPKTRDQNLDNIYNAAIEVIEKYHPQVNQINRME